MASRKYLVFKNTMTGDIFLSDEFIMEDNVIFLGTSFSGFSKLSVGTVAPSNPSVGDLWVDTN